jgi:predicted nuclease with TOPRIM domain
MEAEGVEMRNLRQEFIIEQTTRRLFERNASGAFFTIRHSFSIDDVRSIVSRIKGPLEEEIRNLGNLRDNLSRTQQNLQQEIRSLRDRLEKIKGFSSE